MNKKDAARSAGSQLPYGIFFLLVYTVRLILRAMFSLIAENLRKQWDRGFRLFKVWH